MAKVTKLHNKLVRDEIPTFLRTQGVECEVEIVTDSVRLLRLLLDKLEEESQEAGLAEADHLLEELGDVETVVDGILRMINKTRADLKAQQDNKDAERGALSNGVFLVRTIELEKEETDG